MLVEVGARLRSVVRASDTVARFGGDEFVVLCESVDEEVAARIAESMREAVSRPIDGMGAAFSVTASVGLAIVDAARYPELSSDELLSRADSAMYASKNSGKDTVSVDRFDAAR